jgi:RHS repeat-associated protein
MKSIKRVLITTSIFFLLLSFIINGPAHSLSIPPYQQLQINPRSIAINPLTDQAVVTDFLNKKISVIDLHTQEIISTISLGKMPLGVTIDHELNLALVSHPINNSVSVVSLDSYQVLKTISVGTLPVGISVDVMSHRALVSNFLSNSVSVIDLAALARVGTIFVGMGVLDVAVDPELGLALVANGLGNKVSVIDLESSRVIRTVPVGTIPVSVSINPETHVAGVANLLSNSLTVIDLQSWETRSTSIGGFPLDVAINSLDNRALIICDRERKAVLVDLDTGVILNEYEFGKRFTGVAVNPYMNIGVLASDSTGELTLIQLPNPIPKVNSITPDTVLRGSETTRLTINGNGFIRTSTVSLLHSTPLQVDFIDNHQLEVTIPEEFLRIAGTYELMVTNPAPQGGSSEPVDLQINNPVPTLSALDPAEVAAGTQGFSLNVIGEGFFSDTIMFINGVPRGFTLINQLKLQIQLTAEYLEVGKYLDITAYNPPPGGGQSNSLRFTVLNPVPILTSINPSSIIAGSPDFTLTLNGDNFVKTSIVSFNNQQVSSIYISKTQIETTIPASAVPAPGNYPVKVINPSPGGGETSSLTFGVESPTPPVEPQPEGSFGEKYQDLIPPDVTIPSYDPKRFSLITGLVKNLGGSPIANVSVSIHNRPEYGTAKTDTQGRFSIPVEGGGTITITYKKEGLITTHRKVYVPWNDIAIAETIVMISEDTKSTTLTLDGNPNTIVLHQSTIVTDDRGSRSSTVVFTGDNRAYSVDASGNVIQELTTITTRATEFTTENSMPAKLPPNSAYTYCVELSVDGAQRVRFDKPLILWIDNFLGFNVGERVPVGYYDRDRGVWVPYDNGVVVRLLDMNGDGIADALDSNGDGQPNDLNGNGSFSDEVSGLSNPQRYPPGFTFWRVTVTHFTPWDCNWPYGPPADAIAPNPNGIPGADLQKKEEDDCRKSTNSFVEERSRIFHEDIPIPGTNITLHYTSSRVKGSYQTISVPASGTTVPSSLKRIIVKLDVAGQTFEQLLNPSPNQIAEFVWDKQDHLGKAIDGPLTAHISIGFVYDAVYLTAGNFQRAFAQAGSEVTGIRARQEVISWKLNDLIVSQVGGTGTLPEGWTLSTHHHLSPTDPSMLQKGDGTILKNNAMLINTVAGTGSYGYSGDGGPATQATFSYIGGLTLDASGNLYIADVHNWAIRKVNKDGIISTAVTVYKPFGVAADAAGNLYIANFYENTVWKLDTKGYTSIIAGSGGSGYSGDGGPAKQAKLSGPTGLTVDASGNLYIADQYNCRIRKVDTGGIITTVAGTDTCGYSGDGGLATQSKLWYPSGVAVDSLGNLYIADTTNERIRKVDTRGTIATVAGTGSYGYSGDGGPATQAKLYHPYSIAVDASGCLYITDQYNYRIRKVDTQGTINTVAGTGSFIYTGDGGPATQANLTSLGVAVDAKGNLYIADYTNNRVRMVAPPYAFASSMEGGDIAFTEEGGSGYILSSTGRHKKTIDLDTGHILYTFNYDSNNNLISISDRFGNNTIIQRDANGLPTSITSQSDLTTTLAIDSDNHLTRITYPDRNFYSFEYTPGSLMTAKIDPNGNRFEHLFDPTGRLTFVTDQEGGSWQYSRIAYENGDIRSEVLSAEGNLTSYLDQIDSTGAYTSRITDPAGAETVYTRSADGLTTTKSLPCGMNLTFKYGVDSEYKFQFVKEMREKAPSNLEKVTFREKTYQDTNSDKIPDLITERVTLNGKLTSLVTNTVQSKRTMTSLLGRTTTTFYDPNNLLTTKLSIPGLHDTTFGYDPRGRLTSINTNTRQTTFAYDAQGNLSSITDPESRVTTYFYEGAGRMTGILRPDGSAVGFTYDKNGNMTVLTNPSTINHGFGFNKVNLNSSYQTPLSGSYSYLYNRDRQLLQINFPSGKQIKNIYDKDRLIQTQTPEGNISLNYLCGSKLDSVSKGTEAIRYGYDGSLVTSETLSGTLNQTLNYTYDNDFNLKSLTYAGGTANNTYDNDGLLTGTGSLTITRNVDNGLPEAVAGGTLNVTRIFNGYGELEGQNFTVNGLNLTSWNLTRDKTGRIISKTENVEGINSNYLYTYDSMGRLLTVTKDGALIEKYQYDSIGRRTYEMNVLKGISGRTFTYSDEDHLLTTGNTTYQYDVDGFLTSKTHGIDITQYSYSSRGELLSVILPDGRTIEYINDPIGRRIAKKVNGLIIEKYLWQGLTRLLAVYDGSDNLIARFEYADARMPAAMTKGGVSYYLAYDQVGSLRVITDTSGNVVKRIDYDSFGSIINDTNPGFQVPFGFASGLHDRDTGFVRFGFRDYDPDVGRWTAKDPIRFWRGNIDLYGYVLNNPVNWADPWGLFTIEVNDSGGRNGPPYGGSITVTGENGTTVTVPGSSWPNPNNPNPGIAEGSYNAVFSQTGHHGKEPGVRLENGGNIPTIGPNPAQNNEQFANGVNIHCGDSVRNRGSAGCITIHPDHCQQVWDVLRQRETGTVNITR